MALLFLFNVTKKEGESSLPCPDIYLVTSRKVGVIQVLPLVSVRVLQRSRTSKMEMDTHKNIWEVVGGRERRRQRETHRQALQEHVWLCGLASSEFTWPAGGWKLLGRSQCCSLEAEFFLYHWNHLHYALEALQLIGWSPPTFWGLSFYLKATDCGH